VRGEGRSTNPDPNLLVVHPDFASKQLDLGWIGLRVEEVNLAENVDGGLQERRRVASVLFGGQKKIQETRTLVKTGAEGREALRESQDWTLSNTRDRISSTWDSKRFSTRHLNAQITRPE
jgi:hypothetical protein